jgi:hypothetical protein
MYILIYMGLVAVTRYREFERNKNAVKSSSAKGPIPSQPSKRLAIIGMSANSDSATKGTQSFL